MLPSADPLKEDDVLKTLSRSLVLVLFASLVAASVVTVAAGQQTSANPPAPAAPAPAARPADQTAYTPANANKDPADRLAALRKFKTDFPSSNFSTSADSAILDALIAGFPDRKDEINKAIDTVVANIAPGMPGYLRMSQVQSLVLKLADKKVALDKADSLVGDAMEYLDKDFKQTQAQGIETLGVVHLAKGDTKRAEKEFSDAFATNNTLTRAPVELAQIEARRGNDKAVVTYLMPLSASGKLKTADEDLLRASYKKVHGGSLATFDADVDKVYLDKFPNPIKTVEPYKASAARTNRVVLAEMFTGSGCPPCVSADLALDKVAERYADADVITLAYHANIPQPDPMVVAGNEVRRNYYKVNGVPTIEVDGTGKVGGGAREAAPRTYADYVTMIDKALDAPAGANVTVRATTDGTKVHVTATASNVKSEAKDLKLQIVLAEHELRFVGENGIRFHAMVVRGVGGENQGGFAVNASGETTAEWTFDLAAIREDVTKTLTAEMTKRHSTETPGSTPREYRSEGHPMVEVDPSALSVIAFVQETKGDGAAQTRQVLQAAQANVVK